MKMFKRQFVDIKEYRELEGCCRIKPCYSAEEFQYTLLAEEKKGGKIKTAENLITKIKFNYRWYAAATTKKHFSSAVDISEELLGWWIYLVTVQEIEFLSLTILTT